MLLFNERMLSPIDKLLAEEFCNGCSSNAHIFATRVLYANKLNPSYYQDINDAEYFGFLSNLPSHHAYYSFVHHY